jgi:hypothetical protein
MAITQVAISPLVQAPSIYTSRLLPSTFSQSIVDLSLGTLSTSISTSISMKNTDFAAGKRRTDQFDQRRTLTRPLSAINGALLQLPHVTGDQPGDQFETFMRQMQFMCLQ